MNPLEIGKKWLHVVCGSRVLVTLLLVIVALALAATPAASRLWQYHRDAILTGQWWRMLTGHFTHWTADHAAWDLVMFAGLGAACERISPRRFALLVTGSAIAISAVLMCLMPGVQEYRGLSGIDSGLFMFLATAMLPAAWHNRDRALLTIGAGLIAAFAAKIGYEIAFGSTLFVDSNAGGFVPLPIVHAIGAVCGCVVGLMPHGVRASQTQKLTQGCQSRSVVGCCPQ